MLSDAPNLLYQVMIYSRLCPDNFFLQSCHEHAMTTTKELNKRDYEALSEFRYQLRRFQRFSENAAEAEGLTPLQYFLLLHIKGFPGEKTATVGDLAERLQAQHHSVVALVSRCEVAGLVIRSPGVTDRRQVHVSLTSLGEQCLHRLADLHRTELLSLSSAFAVANISAFNDQN
jgi:DNA-binding MarR family transcriptional regulator